MYAWEKTEGNRTILYYGLGLGMTGERGEWWIPYYDEASHCAQVHFQHLARAEAVQNPFKDFGKYLDSVPKQRIYVALAERGKKARVLLSRVSIGALEKSIRESIAYISRKLIKQRMTLPPLFKDTALTWQELYDHYNDAAMIAWVTLRGDGSVTYKSRGIFRTLFSMLLDGYTNLYIKIHAFTALVMRHLYGLRLFHARSAPAMCKLLKHAFGSTNIFIEDSALGRNRVISIRLDESFECGIN